MKYLLAIMLSLTAYQYDKDPLVTWGYQIEANASPFFTAGQSRNIYYRMTIYHRRLPPELITLTEKEAPFK